MVEISAFPANSSVGTTTTVVTTNGGQGLLATATQLLDLGMLESSTGTTLLSGDTVPVLSAGAVKMVSKSLFAGTASALGLVQGTLSIGGVSTLTITGTGGTLSGTSPSATLALSTGGTISSAAFDSLFGTLQGSLIFRNASAWVSLPPGTSGQFLSSGGTAANPSWATGSGGGLAISAGTTTISGATSLTVSGATLSGTSPSATLTIGGTTYPPSTLDPGDVSSPGTLSNGNLTIAAGAGYGWSRSTFPRSVGKLYFEVSEDSFGTYHDNNLGISVPGFVSNSDTMPGYFAGYNQYADNTGANSVANTTDNLGTGTTGDIICIAVDFTNRNMWVRRNGGNWNGHAGENPATNTGGIFAAGKSAQGQSGNIFKVGPIYAMIGVYTGQVTVNFGATAFAQTIPSGFSAWG